MKEMRPLVSAIITTHNRCELLTRAIDAALSQTYHPMEIIVVDDASTDDTCEVCKKYGSQINYIQIPEQESRGGNYARNLGIKHAKGVYVAFCDDDDYWLPQKTEKQMELIQRKNCEFVYCGRCLEIIKGYGMVYQDVFPDFEYQGDVSKKILQTICCTTTTILAKRQALIEIGLFDEALKFWQEYELTIRMAQRGPFYYVNEPLAIYRIDKSDKARLTNKFDGWRNAVKYIHEKHSILYQQLSLLERWGSNVLYWYDATDRAISSGKKVLAIKYFLLSRVLGKPYKLFHILKHYGFTGLISKLTQTRTR